MYLKQTRNQPGRPCGRIYQEFGLHGQSMELFDASVDPPPNPDDTMCDTTTNGKCDMYATTFGDDQVMSMMPYSGKNACTKNSSLNPSPLLI